MRIGDIEFDVFGDTDPKKMPMHFFHGALEVRFETAVRANPDRQNYSVCPRHWFIEAVFPCADCGQHFDFSVREQRLWYERWKFYSDSRPIRCPKCRRFARTIASLKKSYDAGIASALRAPASTRTKVRMIQVIDSVAAGSNAISAKMRKSRELLASQIRKREKTAQPGATDNPDDAQRI